MIFVRVVENSLYVPNRTISLDKDFSKQIAFAIIFGTRAVETFRFRKKKFGKVAWNALYVFRRNFSLKHVFWRKK